MIYAAEEEVEKMGGNRTKKEWERKFRIMGEMMVREMEEEEEEEDREEEEKERR